MALSKRVDHANDFQVVQPFDHTGGTDGRRARLRDEIGCGWVRKEAHDRQDAIGSVFFAMGLGLMMPSLQSLATGTVNDDVRGGVLGIYQSTLSLSTIISTAVGGILFAMVATLPYWVAGVMGAIALIPSIALFLRYGRKARSAKTAPSTAD